MKRFSILLSFFFLLVGQLYANDVIVKGVITNANGTPAANYPVRISIDTTVSSCRQVKEVVTNPNGFYTATLSCATNIVKVAISLKICDGNYITEHPQVSPTGVVERNFTLCAPAPPTCNAVFKFEHLNTSPYSIRFNSEGSGGSSLTDAIIKRRWRFGDGSILEGNEISPLHVYAAKGTYEVCLTIVTNAGCEKTVCQQVIIEAPQTCKPYFRFEPIKDHPLSFTFKSDSSVAATANDVIVKRRWRFGDGTILEGNEVSPSHTYAAKGTYEVCLTIVTYAGCEKTICKPIVAELPLNNECRPEFTFGPGASNYKEIKFNSASSTTAAGDVIISRRWLFGDGKEATTIDPVHTYEQDGIYRVCLIIKTDKGCTKELCRDIEIKARKCEAYFLYSIVSPTISNAGYPVKFNSAPSSSNDSIISRKWTFGDGTSATTVDPLHTYSQPGQYTVCLVIKTRNGCESEICKQVLVGPNAQQCATHFTFERLSNNKIRFNSTMSWAAVGDDIIERRWNFGDGSPIVAGNLSSVLKEYNRPGTYSVCLSIKTAKGCESKLCISLKIEDTANRPETAPIKIVTLYPAPVHTQMTTEVWSLHNNVNATIAVYDIYGVKKWEMQKVLVQGVNVTVVPTSALLPGPYFFKVTSMYGTQSRQFYKL